MPVPKRISADETGAPAVITGDDWPFTHTQTYTHKLASKQTCRVETHYECKQTYITVTQAQSDTAL